MKWRENGSLATDVDSKALKGCLSHWREVVKYSEQHLIVTTEARQWCFQQGISGQLIYISDMHWLSFKTDNITQGKINISFILKGRFI